MPLSEQYVLGLWRFRQLVVVLLIALSGLAGYVALVNAKLATSFGIAVFDEDHPFTRAKDMLETFKSAEIVEPSDGPIPRYLRVCRLGDTSRAYGYQVANRSTGQPEGGTARRRTSSADPWLEPFIGQRDCAWFWCETDGDPQVYFADGCECKARLQGDCADVGEDGSVSFEAYAWVAGPEANATLTTAEWEERIRGSLEGSWNITSIILTSSARRMPDLMQQHWESGRSRAVPFYLAAVFEVVAQNISTSPVEACEYHEVCTCRSRGCLGDVALGEYGVWESKPAIRLAPQQRQLGYKPAALAPIQRHLLQQVTVIFGITPAMHFTLLGSPKEYWWFDEDYDASHEWAQRAARAICMDLPEELQAYTDGCLMDYFYDTLQDQQAAGSRDFFPVRQDEFLEKYLRFVNPSDSRLAFEQQFWKETWFEPCDSSDPAIRLTSPRECTEDPRPDLPRVRGIKLEFPCAVLDMSTEGVKKFKEAWDDFLEAKNREN